MLSPRKKYMIVLALVLSTGLSGMLLSGMNLLFQNKSFALEKKLSQLSLVSYNILSLETFIKDLEQKERIEKYRASSAIRGTIQGTIAQISSSILFISSKEILLDPSEQLILSRIRREFPLFPKNGDHPAEYFLSSASFKPLENNLYSLLQSIQIAETKSQKKMVALMLVEYLALTSIGAVFLALITVVSAFFYRKLQKKPRIQEDTLRFLIEDLSLEEDLDVMFEKALRSAMDLLEAEGAGIALLDSDGQYSYRWGIGLLEIPGKEMKNRPFQLEAELITECPSSAKGLIIGDYQNDRRAVPWIRDLEVRTSITTPVYSKGILMGTFSLYSRGSDFTFRETDLPFLHTIALQIGTALQRKALINHIQEQKDQLQMKAYSDPLTKLPNRSAFEEKIEESLSRASRQNKILALGMLDLDGFKPINDKYGHHIGDCFLSLFSRRLSTILRQTDFLARLGGDEFALIFEGLESPEEILGIINRLEPAIFTPIQIDNTLSISVGGSLGIALFPSINESSELLRQADQAMYQVKLLKGNRSQFWLVSDHQSMGSKSSTSLYGGDLSEHLSQV